MQRSYWNLRLPTCQENQLNGNSKDWQTELPGTGTPHLLKKPVERNIYMHTSARERSRVPRTISTLLAVFPLTSALIFVDPVAPSAKAHATCTGTTHTYGDIFWVVKSSHYVAAGIKEVVWQKRRVIDGVALPGFTRITCRV